MSELIKGSLKPIIVDGDKPISNRIHKNVRHGSDLNAESMKGAGADFVVDMEDIDPEPEQPKEQQPTIDLRELEELRDHYKREGEEYAQSLKRKAELELAKAREDAENIRTVAENQRLEKLRALEADNEKALEKARKTAFEAGYNEGMQKGTDDGYAEGLNKCRDTLADLKSICDSVEQEKAALMAENRRGIFDIAIAVAEKITMTVFEQKDKRALEKMITEAAKEFRSAKSVRVSLSKLDLGEDVEADLKVLEKCFSSTVNVEFEVLDTDRGTLLLETDSEILDVGVSTQLKMIEELGKGKFRDKEPEAETAEELEEAVKTEKPKKTRKPEAPKAAEPAEESEEAAEPEYIAEPEEIEEEVKTEKPKKAKKAEAPKAPEPAEEPEESVDPEAMAELIAGLAEEAAETVEDTAEEQEATEEQ